MSDSFTPLNWDNMISMAEAAEMVHRDDKTLLRNIQRGIIIEGIDCKKVGRSWIIDKRRLQEIYEGKEFIYE